ncbi:SusC/RagA family TonB-linked outer membrane protein [Flavobacteriaceae bacterium F08102]|nr:SusC/RagA family TonB-linked outer membrane protein [Flavobacteriaceae bacterium F08102]
MEIKLNPAVFWYKKKQLINKLMRAFIFLYSAIVFSFTSTNVVSQNSTISISSDEILSVEQVFDLIMNQTEYNFIYEEGTFKDFPQVYVKKGKIKTNKLLQLCLENQHLDITLTANNTILIRKKPTISQAIQQQLTGVIKDETGLPIPGVTILIKGTQTGTSTDFDGKFSLTVPGPSTVLVFSSIGYQTKEITVGEQKNLTVVLKEELNTLDEVIITGYQKISVERSTGSSITIDGKQLEKRGRSNLVNTLEGQIAGLGITADVDNEGAKKIDIRGISTINGNSQPLIVIDGFPANVDIAQINPYDIESLTVLKDAGAASIYGARAANGVIVIVTKKGKKGTLSVNYTNNFTFSQKPDMAYRLNRLSSSELVDAQILGAQQEPSYSFHTYQWVLDNNHFYKFPIARTQVFNAMAAMSEGSLTQAEVDAKINPLRTIDNTNQIRDYFSQSPIEKQHNLMLSGGGENNVYRATLNYTSNKSSFVGDESDRIIFDIQNSTDLSDKLKLDLNANITLDDRNSIPYNREIVLGQVNSYELFADENGNPLPVTVGNVGEFGAISSGGLFGGKDPIEIQRLIDLGLYDETYYPLNELDSYTQENKGLSTRIQAMLHADILKGLKGSFGFQYQQGANSSTRIAKESSFEIRSLVNNLSPRDYNGDNTTLNLPRGGRIIETRGDSQSYTGRIQLDYETNFGKHTIRALAGSEIRHLFNSSTTTDQFGYDEFSLNTVAVDKYRIGSDGIGSVQNINHPNGQLQGGIRFSDNQSESTNRFFSAYGNFSYDFDRRYVVTGSVRLDQSNLFGTDPKYRYKPFWSTGFKWNISDEDFFEVEQINQLSLRATYGINGNIANLYGPFDIAAYTLAFRADGSEGLEITSPAIKNLRWERTATTNIGLNVTAFNNRINLGLDYYRKNTSDIFATGKNNPVNGTNRVLKNDATITNNGYELSLGTTNIRGDNFSWRTNIVLRSNKNKVEKVAVDELAPIFLAQRPQNKEGYPANSFYVFDWAGLDADGNVTIKTNNDEIKTVQGFFSPYNDVTKEDLVYAGTLNPTFTGSITNNFAYKNFNLSLMFVTSQGHKLLKDSYNGEAISSQPQNVNADARFAWETPGDELFTDIPAIGKARSANYTPIFSKYSTKNVVDAGFVRLREVLLSYSLPTNALKALPLNSLNINMRANNIWLIANNKEGIDPESHGIGTRYFPIQPSFTIGLNASF